MKFFVSHSLAIAAVALLIVPPASAQDESPEEQKGDVEREIVVEAKREKITDRSHPNYVRCKSERVLGSLAKRRRICMTNAQWAEASEKGNESSREFIDQSQPGFMAGGN
ncbi:MAG: hypothetical protein AAGH53_11775 [Pseudomonadota bacterium]